MANPTEKTGSPQEDLTQRISAQASSVGDRASEVDELGFELYVNALADFLVAPNTRAPLTCSVEGTWGSGKSSFMLQLRNRLRIVAPSSRAIEFNAWKYDRQEELWAAFALKVTRSLREGLGWARRLQCDFHLFRTRIKGWTERLALLALVLAWLLILSGLVGVIVWTTRASHEERLNLFKPTGATKNQSPATKQVDDSNSAREAPTLPEPWYEWLSWSPLATSAVLIVLLTGKIPESLRKRLFEAQLERYIDKPDYKGKAAFVDAFSEDFAKMMEAYAPSDGGKTFVFIDDLDRCEAPKAADLMQAINLMIGDGNSLIFILGLDRAKVAAAITFKFREIVPYLNPPSDAATHPEGVGSFGDAFLEKFIQLSFRLPVSSNEVQARKFIDSLVADAAAPATEKPNPPTPEEADNAAAISRRRALRIEAGAESQRIRDVVMMVREVVEYSPRRIKNFLTSFRLALYIASAQGLLDVDSKTGEAEVTPERLGKFLVISSRYPELRSVLDRNPDFLYEVERFALGPSDQAQWSEFHRELVQLPGIRKLMSYGFVDKTRTVSWARKYSMKNFPGWKFSTILPRVPPPAEQETSGAQSPGPASERVPAATAGTRVSVQRPIDPIAVSQKASFNDAQPASSQPDLFPGDTPQFIGETPRRAPEPLRQMDSDFDDSSQQSGGDSSSVAY